MKNGYEDIETSVNPRTALIFIFTMEKKYLKVTSFLRLSYLNIVQTLSAAFVNGGCSTETDESKIPI